MVVDAVPRSAGFRCALLLLALVVARVMGSCGIADARAAGTYPPMYRDAAVFRRAIERECRERKQQSRITGITVPHHLLAADLIARGFCAAANLPVERVIVLSPD